MMLGSINFPDRGKTRQEDKDFLNGGYAIHLSIVPVTMTVIHSRSWWTKMNKNDVNPITHGFAIIHRLRQARTFAFALTLQNSRNVDGPLRTHPPAGMSPPSGPLLPLRHRDVTTEEHGGMILHLSTVPANAGTNVIGSHHIINDDRLYRSHQLLWDYARNVNYTAQDCFIHVFNLFLV